MRVALSSDQELTLEQPIEGDSLLIVPLPPGTALVAKPLKNNTYIFPSRSSPMFSDETSQSKKMKRWNPGIMDETRQKSSLSNRNAETCPSSKSGPSTIVTNGTARHSRAKDVRERTAQTNEQ
jgi:hypothetical protein